MKNYYKILEVSENATQVEIKRAYRALAKKYHPDRSSVASASQLFSEINEAYEVLSDTVQKSQYDLQKSGGYNEYKSGGDNKYKNRKYQQAGYRSAYKPNRSQRVDLNLYTPYFKAVSVIGLVVSLFLSTDFLIPRKAINDRILNIENIVARSRNGEGYLIGKNVTTSDVTYNIEEELTINLYKNQLIKVNKTRLLSISTSVDFGTKEESVKYILGVNIYRNLSFAWIILLITSILGVVLKKPAEMILNLGIVNGILTLLVLYFTAIS